MRYTGEARLHFKGDRETCQRYIPLARTFMGTLLNQLALGGLKQGVQRRQLPDGTLIEVRWDGVVANIRIDTRKVGGEWREELYERVPWIPSGFLCIPASDLAPDGWGFPGRIAGGALPQALLTRQPEADYPSLESSLEIVTWPYHYEDYEPPGTVTLRCEYNAEGVKLGCLPEQVRPVEHEPELWEGQWQAFFPEEQPYTDSLRLGIFDLTNAERAAAGRQPFLPPLRGLYDPAQRTAEITASTGILEHNSAAFPVGYQTSDERRKKDAPFSVGAENLARGSLTAEAVVEGWMESTTHRANILSSDWDGYKTSLYVGRAGSDRAQVMAKYSGWLTAMNNYWVGSDERDALSWTNGGTAIYRAGRLLAGAPPDRTIMACAIDRTTPSPKLKCLTVYSNTLYLYERPLKSTYPNNLLYNATTNPLGWKLVAQSQAFTVAPSGTSFNASGTECACMLGSYTGDTTAEPPYSGYAVFANGAFTKYDNTPIYLPVITPVVDESWPTKTPPEWPTCTEGLNWQGSAGPYLEYYNTTEERTAAGSVVIKVGYDGDQLLLAQVTLSLTESTIETWERSTTIYRASAYYATQYGIPLCTQHEWHEISESASKVRRYRCTYNLQIGDIVVPLQAGYEDVDESSAFTATYDVGPGYTAASGGGTFTTVRNETANFVYSLNVRDKALLRSQYDSHLNRTTQKTITVTTGGDLYWNTTSDNIDDGSTQNQLYLHCADGATLVSDPIQLDYESPVGQMSTGYRLTPQTHYAGAEWYMNLARRNGYTFFSVPKITSAWHSVYNDFSLRETGVDRSVYFNHLTGVDPVGVCGVQGVNPRFTSIKVL